MYYSNGNYEAFARPRKPDGLDGKTAWFVGSGLASLAGAAFLVRDGQMTGNKITILEEQGLPGGALDGIDAPKKGFIIRGGRELESNMECLWDLYRSIPSLEIPDASVLDEFYWLNKDDPNFSLQRATIKQGQDAHTDGKFNLSDRSQKQLIKLFLATRQEMEGKRINEVFDKEFLQSNFWLYWRTMFAFQEWHSALEMKLYLHRFIHHIHGMPDFSTLKFTKYNQYESLALPLYKWLVDQGVTFQYNTTVTDVDFSFEDGCKKACQIYWTQDDIKGGKELTASDLLFMTIGSLTENSDSGDHQTPAKLLEGPAPAFDLWRNIAVKDPSFGRPDVFGSHVAETKWESATMTTLDKRIPSLIQKICKRDPFSGRIVTGAIVTVKDSKWLMSWAVSRQPHFKKQPKDQIIVWIYGLFVGVPGDFVKKPFQECTGEEITREWLYHMGASVQDIPELAATGATTVPVMMPYVTSFFMPRHAHDRPDVVPKGSTNFAFIGQFAESGRDCCFTTEYSVRTAMEAVYKLLGVDRGVPEVYSSTFDVRTLLKAIHYIRDGKGFNTHFPSPLQRWFLRKLDENEVGKILQEYHFFQE